MLGVPEEQRAKVEENTRKTPKAGQEGRIQEKVADPTMEQLAARVEQANIDSVQKDTHGIG